MSIKKLQEKFENIAEEEIDVTEMNELEERVSDLEEEIYEEMGSCTENEYKLQALLKNINVFKKNMIFTMLMRN